MIEGSGFSLGLRVAVAEAVTWALGRYADALGLPTVAKGADVLMGAIAVGAAFTLWRQWRQDRETLKTLKPSGLYGSAKVATGTDAIKFGLGDKYDGKGIFLGAVGKTILSYHGQSNLTIIAPNAGGKTESISQTNALGMIDRNAVFTDKGGEVAIRTWRHRRDVLKQSVVVINPWTLWSDLGLPNHHYNPFQILVRLAEANDPEIVDTARSFAAIIIVDPETKGDSQFFREAGRDLGSVDI